MPKIHITKEEVERLTRPVTGRIDYFDDVLRGFGVRVSALNPGDNALSKTQEKTAGKTYFTMRRVNGKLVRAKIDTADKITAEKARKQAEGILADMGKGIDPNEEKRKAIIQAETTKREGELKGTTLQDVLTSYIDKRDLKPRSVTTIEKLFRLYLTDWLLLPVQEITKQMVSDRHSAIAKGKRTRPLIKRAEKGKEQPRKASADNCMRSLRSVLNFHQGDNEAYLNPVRILSQRREWYKVGPRRTLIKNSDLPAWFKAVCRLDNPIMRDYLLFVLFTGLRNMEAATIKWSQVDFEERTFTIPDTKNNEIHTLPLSDFLYNLLKDRQESLKTELAAAKVALANMSNKLTKKQEQTIRNRVAFAEFRLASPYVFPGDGKTGHMVESKTAIKSVTENTGIVFSPHDLRRTFATLADSLELSRYTVKALLNHKQESNNDVTGDYIIIHIDRLRAPMQRITDAILERIKNPYGQVLQFNGKVASPEGTAI